MLTTFDLDRYVYAALSIGASGFLLKDVTAEHLAAAVRLVDTGDALLAPVDHPAARASASPPRTARRRTARRPPRPRRADAARTGGADPARAAACPTPNWPQALTLSEATVKTHVARIFAKLSLRDRAQAVVLAYETGLVTPGDS